MPETNQTPTCIGDELRAFWSLWFIRCWIPTGWTPAWAGIEISLPECHEYA